ncbi:flagellar hook-basal body complex protein FliE [Qipengyuania sp. MTN3-11]|uniref:flagellar hook-basal body complex protein FliE n=1 Tax=Qipengyuania sp. MTN3-11 TaxID=3056557 RepID=UPI0036F37B2B
MNPVGGIGGGGSLEQIIALRQQIIDRSKVLQDVHQPKPAAPTEAGGAAAPNFGDSLRNALDNVNAVQAESSRMTAAYERGEETDIAKVMLARQEAGVAFEATLQVRNKLLAAYQETMRMGI